MAENDYGGFPCSKLLVRAVSSLATWTGLEGVCMDPIAELSGRVLPPPIFLSDNRILPAGGLMARVEGACSLDHTCPVCSLFTLVLAFPVEVRSFFGL